MNKISSRKNGKLGGRPTVSINIRVNLPNIEFVILTPKQYAILLKKYGEDVVNKAINILEKWLKSSPKGVKYVGKNNYGHFRSDGWVINSARLS